MGFRPLKARRSGAGGAAQAIDIPVAGAQELYLFVTGVPDVAWGVADWAGAQLLANDGSASWLSELKILKVLEGRHELDLTLHSGLFEPLRLNGKEFRAMGSHLNS